MVAHKTAIDLIILKLVLKNINDQISSFLDNLFIRYS